MKRSTKVVVGCVLAAAGVVCAVLLFNGSGSPPPDPNEATAQETVEYLASEEFVKMDNDNKEEYLEQVSQTYTETPMLTLLLNSSLSELAAGASGRDYRPAGRAAAGESAGDVLAGTF